jgi:hypothetical protein
VKDDADRVAYTASNAADAMSEIDAVCASRTFNGPIVHGEGNCITLPQRHYLGSALHSRALFC